MAKRKGSFKDCLFFLLGALVYSFFFWSTGHNYAHTFGIIFIVLACYILYKIDRKREAGKEWITTRSVISMCAGAIFDSLSSGFPFGFFH